MHSANITCSFDRHYNFIHVTHQQIPSIKLNALTVWDLTKTEHGHMHLLLISGITAGQSGPWMELWRNVIYHTSSSIPTSLASFLLPSLLPPSLLTLVMWPTCCLLSSFQWLHIHIYTGMPHTFCMQDPIRHFLQHMHVYPKMLLHACTPSSYSVGTTARQYMLIHLQCCYVHIMWVLECLRVECMHVCIHYSIMYACMSTVYSRNVVQLE